ncbi:putative ABC transporter periplasmic substrate-binding protein [Selenomonas ruminantium subsp. lactilytica TAM6421]|uniref:Putative ABC transporter periplasmic substrate-binding protein n=1 Tax=Selenomonas ruminantium subsp. lactilytica (strain NBRC 103574 / TAM6421) TaxID=927704 RepID=I0GRM4_SELRL|nr:ABC transporter substrate-binding protein [Selenomonas ruminantium]BAL83411.1 putative ABC transporter periplasmic substrate-binding protein [Selenomonas ruminantium subsp. lactilytica TAM6421]
MKRHIGILLTFIMAVSILLVGCGSDKAADQPAGQQSFAVVTDDLGRNVEFSQKPARIVVTSASFLEPLEAVGGADLVVGRPDSKTKMPAFAKDLTSVGKVYQVDTEKIMACQPDLVIINKGMNEKLVDTLEANGIKTLVLDMKSYEDVKREVATLAKVTGNPDKGQQLVSSMEEKIAAVKAKIPADKRRTAIIHSTNQGLTVQLDGSIAGSIVKMLGWENVASNMEPLAKNPDAAPYSLETLVEKNPDVIFITSMGKMEDIKAGMDKTLQSPAWQSVTAVKEGKVYYLPQDLFLLSPGIHYPEAVEQMAKCLYPEVFE